MKIFFIKQSAEYTVTSYYKVHERKSESTFNTFIIILVILMRMLRMNVAQSSYYKPFTHSRFFTRVNDGLIQGQFMGGKIHKRMQSRPKPS